MILVGAGPGDAELLTLKAVRAIKRADVVLHDRLVGSDVLGLARREAEIIEVGKRSGQPSTSQGDINAMILAHASAGKIVVRLKGGDGFVFGRAAEELAAAAAAGIEVDVVPGITTRVVFNPNRTGTYQVICAELCGVGHAVMRSRVIVMAPAAYDAWLANARTQVAAGANPTPAPPATTTPAQP